MTTMKRRYPDGIALEPSQIVEDNNGSLSNGTVASPNSIDELFITMCFYARLGFIQPPSCLKCAHRKSTKKDDTNEAANSQSCNNLVPWRRDANVSLHPDGLEENLVFVTCETAQSLLIRGDAYPSIQWDNRNRRILHEM